MNLRFAFCTAVAACALAIATVSWADQPWRASVHLGTVSVDRLARDSGQWWSDIDGREAGLAISIGYDLLPTLGVRALYERANGLGASNVCPDNGVCPAIAISEELDLDHWQLAIEPRYPLGNGWSVFATLGIMDWKLRRDDILPGDSGTHAVFGAGASWRVTGRMELQLEYQRSGIDYDVFRLGAGLRC